MKEKDVLTFRKGDAAAICAVVLFALAILAFFLHSAAGGGEKTVRIYLNGECVREMPLNRDGEYLLSGVYENRIVIRDGKAAILESTCPGEDCVHSGWISQTGRSVVCLPNRVEVRIEGVSGADDVDAVVQ